MSNGKSKTSKETTQTNPASAADGREDGDVRASAQTEERQETLLGASVLYRRNAKEVCPGLILNLNPDETVSIVYFSSGVPDRCINAKQVKIGTAVGECHFKRQAVMDAIEIERRLAPVLNS